MIIPDKNGVFNCSNDDYKTTDIFNMLDHHDIEYEWDVRLSKKYSLDMYKLLLLVNDLLYAGNVSEVMDHVQSAALLLVNASMDSLDEFMEEVIVRGNLGNMFQELESILREDS